MKYIIVITSWVLCFSLSYCQTVECSSSAEVAVISDNLVQIVKPDESIVQPYKVDITVPSACNIDRTCSSLLFEVEIVNEGRKLREKHLWIPDNGPMHYYTINVNESDESAVTHGPTLRGNDCFKFFHIDSRHLGALCIGRRYDEDLVVPYVIEYNEQGIPHDIPLGNDIHLNIENHSPFIVLNNTGMLKAVGISYFEHRSAYKLIIIHYNSGSDDVIDVPSDCPGPHDLQPVNQSNAIVRCANGKVLYFDGWHLTLTTLTGYSNIEIISTCPNTTSFVLVQGTDKIIFNKLGVNYHLSVNASVQPLRITYAACYATGEDDITFYYADTTSGVIYKLFLGDIITSTTRQGMVPQIVKGGKSSDGAIIGLYIDGPILWGKLAAISNRSDVTMTDVLTERQSPLVAVNGPNVFVQLYTAEKCKVDATDKPTNDGKQQDSNDQSTGGIPQYVIPLGAVIGIILLIIFLIGFVIIYMHRRRKGSQHRMESHDTREMEPVGSIQSDDRSQTPGSTDNSASPLIGEQYEPGRPNDQQVAVPRTHEDDRSADATPVQTRDRQLGELVSPANTVVVSGIKQKTATPNPAHPSSIDEVD